MTCIFEHVKLTPISVASVYVGMGVSSGPEGQWESVCGCDLPVHVCVPPDCQHLRGRDCVSFIILPRGPWTWDITTAQRISVD